jgi:hypothetical protein
MNDIERERLNEWDWMSEIGWMRSSEWNWVNVNDTECVRFNVRSLFWFLQHMFWGSTSHSIWHLLGHTFWFAFWWFSRILSGIRSDIILFACFQAFILVFFASNLPFSRTFFLAFCLASRLKSGSACPLQSGTRSWGPAVPAEIWRSQLGSGSAHWDLEFGEERRERKKVKRRGGSNSDKI